MNAATILDGAFRWARDRRDVTYRMGAEDPRKNGAFDCSAWVWNLLGERKRDRNTDWILRDATGAQTWFRQLDAPVPGCIAVYGTRWEKTGGKVKRHAGHVGVVVDVGKKLAIDCSSSQNGIRLHRQRVLFDGPSDGRKVVFCECVGAA
jgi:hypothetical protein